MYHLVTSPFARAPFFQAHGLASFDDLLCGYFGTPTQQHLTPALDIVATADGFEVDVDLPGVHKDDLKVNIQDNVLRIEAEIRPQAQPEQDPQSHTPITRERRTGRWYRALRLGKAVNQKKVAARYQDGVLKLTLPHAPEPATREVKVAVH